ncbi:S9 family peptidase [Halomarina oriensis]|uniref:Prolyl oligopeptidase family serine peptidase n=1 Tax=Halomarina oriensis TaxID=671145 RepID=A0A6B0GQU7_9EURY|nr:S9 family peptidase [Halomarina oriensis]MWG35969.1 prolyl oligopeptidase family serine peptidase [Halomarina oriensis]
MEPLPTEVYYDQRRVGSPTLSPDGERVAFVLDEFDQAEDERRSSVFVVPVDGARPPHRLTRVSDASSPQFSPDGSTLGVLMTRERDVTLRVGRDDEDEADETDATDGDEGSEDDEQSSGHGDGETQVWTFDLEWGGDARQVTDREHGVSAFDWSPDGERIVVAGRDPTDDQRESLDDRRDGGPIETERLQHKYDGTGWLDTVRTYLFVVNVASRDVERLDGTGLSPSVADTAGRQPSWGDRGVAFVGYDGADPDDTAVRDLFLVDPDDGAVERLTDGTTTCERPTWSPDGRRLAYRARDPENWYRPTELAVLDLETGESTTLSANLDRTLGTGSPRWSDDERLVCTLADEGWTRFARFHLDGPPERVYAAQSRDETVKGFDLAGGTVAFTCSAPDAGTELYAMAESALDGDGERGRLTESCDEFLAEHGALAVRRVTFDSEEQTVEGIAYYPSDFDPTGPDPRPFLLDVHGGPMSYDAPGWDFDAAFWTSRGYVVFRVNYRGSTSYGRSFSEQLKGRWNSLEVQDLQAGVDWMVERGWADPERLFCTGFSQGGVNTAYLVTRTDRFAAAATEHGVYDLSSSFGTDDSQNWLEADFGLPWENPEAYRAASSIDDVGNVETPLLVTAGENDWRCPPTQAEQLYVSVRKRGVDAKLVVYQNEHHAISRPERAIHRLETLEEWFGRYGGPTADDGEEDDDGNGDVEE